ncbi:MAG: Hsp70 family protein [Candidatus Cloacimonetes bacterium]|nr:Hsp70 family protein [Candidatus Cloacimonadota bacterium]
MKHIGIDLGTTNSLVALKKLKTEIIPNTEKSFLTRSCVTIRSIEDTDSKKGKGVFKTVFSKNKKTVSKEFIVGEKAFSWLKQDPENTILSIKRLIGRGFSEPEIQEIISDNKLNYKIGEYEKGTENSLGVLLDGQTYLPEEISAEILKKLKSDAEIYLNDTIENAVITVPAYFNDKQKFATRISARKAGFKVLRLLAEPTAAAISFGINEMDAESAKTILVYDFGGGTFDVSVLTIAGGQFIEQGKGGDMWLGGDDIDHLLIKKIYRKVEEEYEINNLESTIGRMSKQEQNIFRGSLFEKVEKAKIELSDKESVFVEVLGLLKDEGDLIDIEVEISRAEFEELLEETVLKSVDICKQVIKDIDLTPDMIDNYLLIGGSTYIPLVRRIMKEEFGDDKVLIHERPMYAVAEGAAILAHKLSKQIECVVCGQICDSGSNICSKCGYDFENKEIQPQIEDIVYSSSHDYFIKLADGSTHKIIEKNMPLPIDFQEIFKTQSDNQQIIHLQFINSVNDKEESIGDLWMTIDEGYPKGTELAVKIHIDADNVIEITVNLLKNPEVKISKTLSRGLADEKLLYEIEKVINETQDKKLFVLKIKEIISKAVEIISKANLLIDEDTGKINQEMYHNLYTQLETMKFEKKSDISPEGIVNTAQSIIDGYHFLIEENLQKKMKNHIKKIDSNRKKNNSKIVYQECEKLQKCLKNLDPIVLSFVVVEQMHGLFFELKMFKEASDIENRLKKLNEYYEHFDAMKFTKLMDETLQKYQQKYSKLKKKTDYTEISKGITK